jgi:DNA polymerase (family X)
MPKNNNDIAKILYKIANLLDIDGANPFRIRAYRQAAMTIANMSRNLTDMVENGQDLAQLPGIGKDLSAKITGIIVSGKSAQLEELTRRIPEELTELMTVDNLGPKRIKILYEQLKIKTFDELEEAAATHKIQELRGFGEKGEQKILSALEQRKKDGAAKRLLYSQAEQITWPLVRFLQEISGVKNVLPAGSYRRKSETVGDLDVLVTCADGPGVMDRFCKYEQVAKILSQGDTRSSVVFHSGVQVDVRVVPEASFGAAMHYFTGSKAHNIAIRTLGIKKGLKINEYGIFHNDERIAGETEEQVFAQVDLPFIEPELREDRGEIEAAQNNQLPRLVTLQDIKGDLQSHTKETDGRFSLEEMAQAAKNKGYQYFAITDHSKRVSMAHGLDQQRLAQQIKEIDHLNASLHNFQVLKSVEVDILEDGTLDLADDILKELDIVVCSIHYNLNLPREKQTERILRAMDNPCFNILAHPTGRLIGKRPSVDIDLERIMQAAKNNGCYLELNAQPERLDLSDIYCKMAKDLGVKLAISTDAHTTANLDFMQYGVNQARRGWLEADDVLNTRTWPDLRGLLKRN